MPEGLALFDLDLGSPSRWTALAGDCRLGGVSLGDPDFELDLGRRSSCCRSLVGCTAAVRVGDFRRPPHTHSLRNSNTRMGDVARSTIFTIYVQRINVQ